MTKQEIQKRIEELQNQIDELKKTAEEAVDKPFERDGGHYYSIIYGGHALETVDYKQEADDQRYAVGNYCRDERLMKKRAAKEVLSRLIWREAEIANAGREDEGRYRYVIDYNASLKTVIYCQVLWHLESPGRAGFIHVDDVRACVKDVVIPFVKSCPELGWELKEEKEK